MREYTEHIRISKEDKIRLENRDKKKFPNVGEFITYLLDFYEAKMSGGAVHVESEFLELLCRIGRLEAVISEHHHDIVTLWNTLFPTAQRSDIILNLLSEKFAQKNVPESGTFDEEKEGGNLSENAGVPGAVTNGAKELPYEVGGEEKP